MTEQRRTPEQTEAIRIEIEKHLRANPSISMPALAAELGLTTHMARYFAGRAQKRIRHEAKLLSDKWIYVAEFSTNVENLKRLNANKVLSCVAHPCIPGDVLVVVQTAKENVMDLPFNTYSDDRTCSDSRQGGLRVWKVTDVNSFRGPNRTQALRAEYSV